MKTKILHIGPLGPQGNTLGGMVSYMEGFLKSDLPIKYDIKVINTLIPSKYKNHQMMRLCLSLKFFHSVILELTKFKPRIVHIHMSSGRKRLGFWEKFIFGYVCKLFRKKVIFHLHGSDFDQFMFAKKNKYFISKVLKVPDKNIILSKNWYEEFLKLIPQEKLILIPNAIDTRSFSQSCSSKNHSSIINILFVGSVGERKGLKILGDAIHLLKGQGVDNFTVDIIGDEEKVGELIEINQYYNNLDINKFFKFHGTKYGKDKIDYFKNANIFVLPSWHESFGIVNLEAMAAGLPVISTYVGAVPEYIVEGENGFLFKPGDSHKLAYYLKILINNSDKRYEMGMRNIKKVKEQFDWEIISHKISNLYKSLIE